MDEENIVAKVHSELIHPLRKTLPSIDTASYEPYERTVDLPEFGRLIVTFKKFNHRHYKSGYSFWVVQRVVNAKNLRHEGRTPKGKATDVDLQDR